MGCDVCESKNECKKKLRSEMYLFSLRESPVWENRGPRISVWMTKMEHSETMTYASSVMVKLKKQLSVVSNFLSDHSF